MMAKRLIGVLAGLALTGFSTGAYAGSDMEKALEAGAKRLTADEITERLSGKTVTFVTASGDKSFLVYYGDANEAAGSKIGGGWSDKGLYAVTDRDQICLGWENSDLPRLRCMDVLAIDGVLHKFKADGTLSGRITKVADGNQV